MSMERKFEFLLHSRPWAHGRWPRAAGGRSRYADCFVVSMQAGPLRSTPRLVWCWTLAPQTILGLSVSLRLLRFQGVHLDENCKEKPQATPSIKPKFHIPILDRILECGMWDVECNPHSTFHIQKCWNRNWNVDCGLWKSTFPFPFQNFGCGMWTCLFENISPIIMLKRIGMWIMDWGNPHSNSRSIFSECGLWNFFENVSPLSHHAKVHWNMDCGMGISTFHNPNSNALYHIIVLGWEVDLFFWECLISLHAKVHWNVDYGKSTFHNPHSNAL